MDFLKAETCDIILGVQVLAGFGLCTKEVSDIYKKGGAVGALDPDEEDSNVDLYPEPYLIELRRGVIAPQ